LEETELLRALNLLLIVIISCIANCSAKATSRLNNTDNKLEKYVFVSFAMPEHSLKEIIKQAKQYEFVPVLRGFKEGSYKKTIEALDHIIKETGYGVIIDPEIYKEFDIKLIPAFVIAEPKAQCLPNTSCRLRNFNRLSGNVTVQFAKQKLFSEKGSL
jgi:conjugal transfer pilus assembly protein TrbC